MRAGGGIIRARKGTEAIRLRAESGAFGLARVSVFLIRLGDPPVLPGWQSKFDISGSLLHPSRSAFPSRFVPEGLQVLILTGCDQAPLRGQQP